MAPDGLIALACAVLTAMPAAPGAPAPQESAARGVENTLAVQTALQKGRALLLRGDARAAVEILEEQLPRINGNREYLMLLRDAYREYIKELALKNRSAEAKKYLERLCILDPAARDTPAAPSASPPARGNSIPVAPKTQDPAPHAPIFRGKRDDDPFQAANQDRRDVGRPGKNPQPDRAQEAARRLVEQASDEFGKQNYGKARLLFEQAHQADPLSVEPVRERWAYCKLHYVVEELNRPRAGAKSWTDLEHEVRVARAMAPRLSDTARWLLREIEERRDSAGARAERNGPAPATLRVRHLERNGQGWYVAETANFRLFHHQDRALVDSVARTAEETRAAMCRKWFGGVGAVWSPRCDIYLHRDGSDYSRATGVSATSPGHSRIESDGGRVVSRRIDLHCDNPTMLTAVLPHETTHVVLAGNFGKHQLPRWADEGMAVLTEPPDQLAKHRKNLERSRDDGQLYPVGELMQLRDYPEARRIGAFYAQSVSLVDFLAKERGTRTFSRFLRDALDDGYEAALRKHYRYRSFEELQTAWSRHVFGTQENYAARGRDR